MKLAVVGGGSTYTPELVDGMARLRDQLPLEELVLIDPDPHRLELVGGVSQRIMAAYDHPAKISWTSDLDAGIDSASAVVLQLRVGGQSARHRDESWPLECGCIGQETTGAGGLAKALRTVPVVLDIAERAGKHAAPGAWIVDFTNPVGIVTRALLDGGHRAVGLCNVAIGFQRYFCAAARRRARAGAARPRRPQPPVVGARRDRRRGRRAAAIAGRPRRRNRRPHRAARLTSCASSASSRRTTCGTTTSTTRWSTNFAGHRRGRKSLPASRKSCSTCTPTRRCRRSPICWHNAAAPTTPSRPST